MKRVLQIALLGAAATGIGVMSASAAPIAPPTAPVEAATQIQQVGDRHYRRHHRYHRHVYRPRVYYAPPYYAYRPYYRDYYYDRPYVYGGIGLPFIGLSIGGGHRHYHHRHHRHHRHW